MNVLVILLVLCENVSLLLIVFRRQMFDFDQQLAKKDGEPFHFVGYIPFEGRLYELDGLQDGPIDLGMENVD